jgi:AbrB family looped-hinge helix DNA binding protein
MSITSIIKIGTDGRMTLPSAIRDQLSLNGEDELQLDCLQGGVLVLKKVNSVTKFQEWLTE